MVVVTVPLEHQEPLTADEYYALAKRVGLDGDARTELLDGEVVWMPPVNDPHAGTINRLNRLFMRLFGESQAVVAVQNPVRVSKHDVPQPDVALLQPNPDMYSLHTPRSPDVLLLVEVSDYTLRTDPGRKARIHGDGDVREYWVVDLNHERIVVHRDPVAGGYAQRDAYGRGEVLSPLFTPGVEIQVDDILG